MIKHEDDIKRMVIDHLWMPFRQWSDLARGFLVFTKGKGCRLTDSKGKSYIDGFSGLLVKNTGYGRKEIVDAIYRQMLELDSMPNREVSIPQAKLAAKMAEITPGDLSKVFFVNSGTEANETALKMAKKYQRLMGFPGRYKVIGRKYSYYGSTYGSMSVSGRPGMNWCDFEPLVPGARRVPHPYCYRCDFELQYPGCEIRCAKELERVIQWEGPETVAAVIMEPMSVSTACTVPPPGYWPLIRSICDRYGVLLIIDEVVTGFGRTGKMFCCEHFGVVPDIMTMAKAMGGGYLPIGAAIATDKVALKFDDGPESLFMHSITFSGHPVACTAALANMEVIEREGLVENSAEMGRYLLDRLGGLSRYAAVGEVRGLGLLCGIELVRDRETKEQFSPEDNVLGRMKARLMEAGLFLLLPRNGSHICIAPPLLITKSDIDEIVSIIEQVIGEIEREILIK